MQTNKDKHRKILKNLLADIRKKSKITQSQLAVKLQKTQSFVSKYENGDCLPDVAETYHICQVLNYSFTELARDFENQLAKLEK